MTPLALREHVADPANLWIRYSFSRWPAFGPGVRCDLANGVLAAAASEPVPDTRSAAAAAAALVRSATDVVYVPPLAAEQDVLRRCIFQAAAVSGAPLLVQVVGNRLLGGSSSAKAFPSGFTELPANAVVVIDLLDSLVRQPEPPADEVRESAQPGLPFVPSPRDAVLVWPLVTGWTDQPNVLEPAIPRYAAAGFRRIAARRLDLDARDRRLLAERLRPTWLEAFDALFHGGESLPDVQAFRRAVEAAGLESRLPRPLPAPPVPSRLRRARELAGHLIELGDAADAGADACYRAARFLDRGEVDIEAAAREGNLGVLPWLEEPARTAAANWLKGQRRSPDRSFR